MPNSGVGAITLISGCTVWVDAVDGTLQSPTGIAGATTKAHRPQWQNVSLTHVSPTDIFRTSPGFLTREGGGFTISYHWEEFPI
jgi:hypothetical protein